MKWLLAAVAVLGIGLMAILALVSGAMAGPIAAQGQRCTFRLPALPSQAANASSPPGPSTTQEQAAGTAEQEQNLQTIISQVKGMGLPERAAIIAVATGLAESGLRNIDYGDRDSLGIFQQRPSMGWGTPAQILDPVYATDKFLNALVQVPNWQLLSVEETAQAVQRSADPSAYAAYQAQATTWVQAAWGSITGTAPQVPPSGQSASPSNSNAGNPLCQAAQQAIAALGSTVSGALKVIAGLWPVVTPIPQPGWIQTLPGVPNWPAGVVQDPPTAISNQCVAGAEWAYDTVHATSFQFPSANGVDVARAAAAAGLVASPVPKAGDLVSFTIPGSVYGHVALVIAVAADRFEVVEQNYIDTQGYASQWNPNGWDVRSVAWPNASVTGFAGT